jgi:hypothetical protein
MSTELTRGQRRRMKKLAKFADTRGEIERLLGFRLEDVALSSLLADANDTRRSLSQ